MYGGDDRPQHASSTTRSPPASPTSASPSTRCASTTPPRPSTRCSARSRPGRTEGGVGRRDLDQRRELRDRRPGRPVALRLVRRPAQRPVRRPEAPEVASDFGTPVDGCESAWQQANSALVYDSADLDAADVASIDGARSAWVAANPGRFTYPAPPDFTGSMAVRTILYDTIGGPRRAPRRRARPDVGDVHRRRPTADLRSGSTTSSPSLWRGGETYPAEPGRHREALRRRRDQRVLHLRPRRGRAEGRRRRLPRHDPRGRAERRQHLQRQLPDDPGQRRAPGRRAGAGRRAPGPRGAARALRGQRRLPGDRRRHARRSDVQAAFAAVPVSPSVLPLDDAHRRRAAELASDYLTAIEDGWVAEVQQK